MSNDEFFSGRIAPAGFGLISKEEFLAQSGLALLQRIVAGEYPSPAMSRQLNFMLWAVSEGHCEFRGMPSEQHLNPLGTVHGGWAATLLDSALGCCVHSTLARGEGYSTIEFKVNLIRPITPKTGEVAAIGKVVNRGRTTAVSEATLKDMNGKLLAVGTETCSIYPILPDNETS
jgi:uncharacterized protein (TIGR00369 family)